MVLETNHILTFQTYDPDYFAEHIRPVTPSVDIQKCEQAPFSGRVELIRLPRLGLFRVALSNARVRVPGRLGYGSLTIPLGNAFEAVTRGQTDIFAMNAAYMAHWADPFDLRIGNCADMLVANIDKPLLHDYIRKLYGGKAPEAFAFRPRLSLATPEGAGLWRYLSFLWNECTHGRTTHWPPLVINEMEDGLVVLLLNALDMPHSDTRAEEARGYPAYLKRVEDYILAHLAEPTSLADLAEVAGVSVRTLSRAFHRRHGQSPMKFLKERRLEAVQRALLAADPKCTTVTDIALRFGFHHLGRFAADYCKAFRELPSETLWR